MRLAIILVLTSAGGILSTQQTTFAQAANPGDSVLEESFVLTDEDSKDRQFEATHAALRAKLGRRINIDFDKTPLVDAMALIAKQIDAPIVIDQEALNDWGIRAETEQTSKRLGSVVVASALDRILSEFGLSWIVRHEVIVVTTQDLAFEQYEDEVYSVTEILTWLRQHGEISARENTGTNCWHTANTLKPNPNLPPAEDQKVPARKSGSITGKPSQQFSRPRLIEIALDPVETRLIQIVKAAAPGSDWEDDDGFGGTLTILDGKLIVWATQPTQESIAVFLRQLNWLIRECETRKAVFCSTRGLGDPANRSVLEKLRRKGSVRFERTTLQDALKQIAKDSDIAIDVDWKGLADDGSRMTDTVTLTRTQTSYGAILDALLAPLQIDTMPRDGGLFVTAFAHEHFTSALYDVRDLTRNTPPGHIAAHLWNTAAETSLREYAYPIETIGGLLLIRASYPLHEKLQTILARMRRASTYCQ